MKKFNDKNENDELIKSLILENEILKKLNKNKITPNQALNSLLNILNNQRGKLDSLTEENKMLYISINRLRNSVKSLSQKNNNFHNNFNLESINSIKKVNFKPNKMLSFSNLKNNLTGKNTITYNSNSGFTTNNSMDRINIENMLQISVTDFKRKKLKPINKK